METEALTRHASDSRSRPKIRDHPLLLLWKGSGEALTARIHASGQRAWRWQG
jgi:hypothetical protein